MAENAQIKTTLSEPPRWGLALSGGGARGAYQYGVWKVLRTTPLMEHMGVMGGTSIGAINTVLFLQEWVTGEELARIFWEELDLSHVFAAVPPGKQDLVAFDYLRLGWDGLQNLGVRIDPLKEWLRTYVHLEELAHSGIVVWANSWDLFRVREEARRYPGCDPETFLEWVMGSASFPLFGPHRYKGHYLLDGGIANNLPLHLVFSEPDIDQVLAVDLGTFMRYHPRQLWHEKQYRSRVDYLRVGLDQPSPAAFSRSALNKMIERGEADAASWWRSRQHATHSAAS